MPPAGYVVTAKPEYIKLENGIITRIQKTEDNPETPDVDEGMIKNWNSKSNSSIELIEFTPGTNSVEDDLETEGVDESKPSTNDTFLIGNHAGMILPETGGSGTMIYRAIGLIIVCLAAALLVRRRN